MNETPQNQVIDHIEIFTRLKRLNQGRRNQITQEILGKRLKMSQAEVSAALNGKRPEKLQKIAEYITRLEEERKVRLQGAEAT